MGEAYNCLECAKVRYNNCEEGNPYGGFLYNKRILRDLDTGKFVFVIDNMCSVSKDELVCEKIAK
jgi:hypothetical protein